MNEKAKPFLIDYYKSSPNVKNLAERGVKVGWSGRQGIELGIQF